MNPKKTLEKFIEQLVLKHGNKYDFSETVYVDSVTPIKVICPKHGPFFPLPSNFLKKGGCRACFIERNRLDIQTVLTRFRAIHLDKYVYDFSNYKTVLSKIKITCPIHGDFTQRVNDHLHGNECTKCGQLKKAEGSKKSPDLFFEKVERKHKNFYKYNKNTFKGIHSKIEIICPKHGVFIQSACNHLKGAGCPACKASKGELMIEFFLKDKKAFYEKQYRIKACKDKGTLPFDFAIFEDQEKTKLKCLIEYDGIQHYTMSYVYDTCVDDFSNRQHHDILKTQFCINNKIELIRIPYWRSNEVQQILTSALEL